MDEFLYAIRLIVLVGILGYCIVYLLNNTKLNPYKSDFRFLGGKRMGVDGV